MPGTRAARLVAALLAAALGGCGGGEPPPPPTPQGPAPDSFRIVFTTSRGEIEAHAFRRWAPRGVDRLHQLVASDFFAENAFYRVVPRFIAQFGAGDDRKATARWDSLPIPDDPRGERNLRGTLAFAQDGPGSRTHQLFFNLSDNAHLDDGGFVPVARVVRGVELLDSINTEYRERPEYHLIATLGNSYLRRTFPRLDYIRSARIADF